jgi:hypothetical protein
LSFFRQIAVSFALAFLFWSTIIVAQGEWVERPVTVPVEYSASGPDLALVGEREKEVFMWLLSINAKVIDEIILTDDFLTATFHTNQRKYFLISNLKSTAVEIKLENQYQHTFSFIQKNKKLLPYHTSVLMHVKL